MTQPDHLGFGYDEPGLIEAVRMLGAALGAAPAGPPVPAATPLPLPATLPEKGLGDRNAMSALGPAVLQGAAKLGHPGYFAHMDPPTPWPAWAATLWAAGLNQNLLHPDTAPVARRLEQLVIGWLAPYFGMSGGHLVPGATLANLTALWAARELRGVKEVVSSEFAHLSIRKAARILGLRHRVVAADDSHRLQEAELGDISSAAVVLTAGSVVAGAIDPLSALPMAGWIHVDAAWGGPLRLSAHYADLLTGIDCADSATVSAHKWLFQPKESAAVFFRDADAAHSTLSFGGGYLAVPNVGVMGSHGSAALPLVATLLAWGRAGLAARIEHCMRLAAQLADRVTREERLELLMPPTTGVVVWRPVGVDVEEVAQRLQRAFVSITDLRGERWFRSVAANPMADPDLVVDDVLQAMRVTQS